MAREAFTIDAVTFAPDAVVDVTYGFPFYRFTYLYDFIEGDANLSAGAALQFRNASIRFTNVDGSQRAISQNLGSTRGYRAVQYALMSASVLVRAFLCVLS